MYTMYVACDKNELAYTVESMQIHLFISLLLHLNESIFLARRRTAIIQSCIKLFNMLIERKVSTTRYRTWVLSTEDKRRMKG